MSTRKRKTEKDPRSQHPAIQALRGLLCRYPNKILWDDLIEKFGDQPDIERLTQCFKAWVSRGFKEINLAWATDWYFNGIPGQVSELTLLISDEIDDGSWREDDFNSWLPVHEMLMEGKDFGNFGLYETWRNNHLRKRPQDMAQVKEYERSERFRQRFIQDEQARTSQPSDAGRGEGCQQEVHPVPVP